MDEIYNATTQMKNVLLQSDPGNWNSEGKRKTVRVSGGSSYRGRLNIQFAMLIIDSLLIFQHFSIQYGAKKNLSRQKL